MSGVAVNSFPTNIGKLSFLESEAIIIRLGMYSSCILLARLVLPLPVTAISFIPNNCCNNIEAQFPNEPGYLITADLRDDSILSALLFHSGISNTREST